MDILYRFKRRWLKEWRETRGQDLIEYALMAGFVAVAAGVVFPSVGSNISAIFSKVAVQLGKASTQGS
jgi:Flp pilus assembly pilin Flp